MRFNRRYGDTFVVPEAAIPRSAPGSWTCRADEQDVEVGRIAAGHGLVLEDPTVVKRKIKRAVTDTDNEVRYDPGAKPGVSNLLVDPRRRTGRVTRGARRRLHAVRAAQDRHRGRVVELLRPIHERYESLAGDPGAMTELLRKGASKARDVASVTYDRAHAAIGLLEG